MRLVSQSSSVSLAFDDFVIEKKKGLFVAVSTWTDNVVCLLVALNKSKEEEEEKNQFWLQSSRASLAQLASRAAEQ